MYAKTKKIVRTYIGKDIKDFMELPDLVDIQLSSYESFIQKKKLDKGEPLEKQGLQGLMALIDRLNGGENFGAAYGS